MKKILFALGVTSLFMHTAYAQSNVTLYGVIDEGINFTTNVGGGHLYNMPSSLIQGDRWGLRGNEDLGGGLKAVFVLENGFDLSSGKLQQGGLEFGRQAYVGMSSSRLGTVTVGRQYDSVVDYVGFFEAGDNWGGYTAAHPGDLDNFNNSQRINNAIKFTSANYSGFTFGGLYSLGGVAGNLTRNQIFSLGAGYISSTLSFGLAYLNVRNPNVSFFGNATSGTPVATTSNIGSSVFAGFGSAKTYQVIGAGTSYVFGRTTFGATYSNIRFENLGGSYAAPAFRGQSGTFNNAEVNFKFYFTPSLFLGGAYDYTRGNSIDGTPAAQYHQGSIGLDYFLSKRTDVYFIGVYQHALGDTISVSGTGITSAVADINVFGASSNQNQFTGRIGIRTKF